MFLLDNSHLQSQGRHLLTKDTAALCEQFQGRQDQGCGVVVDAGVGVGRSRPFSLESELELESVKFRPLRLRLGVEYYRP